MAETTKKVIADVPGEVRDEIDTLGPIVDMTMGQMVREALERFLPILRERAAERKELREAATATISG